MFGMCLTGSWLDLEYATNRFILVNRKMSHITLNSRAQIRFIQSLVLPSVWSVDGFVGEQVCKCSSVI